MSVSDLSAQLFDRESGEDRAPVAGRAVSRDAGEQSANSYFVFARGLADYRQGQFDRAIAAMRGDAGGVLGPCPRLVLAMALHQVGKVDEARKVLASAVLSEDWRANRVRDIHACINHVLRREAEAMILPNLPAFLDGRYRPRDNDERLALLGVCAFKNRTHATVRLYADAFAAEPALAENLADSCRYNAARAAVLAGCGSGADTEALGDDQKAKLREQARQWLSADLAARAFNAGSTASRTAVRQALRRWQSEPDLAGLRDPDRLNKLPAEERRNCLSLWEEVDQVLRRNGDVR